MRRWVRWCLFFGVLLAAAGYLMVSHSAWQSRQRAMQVRILNSGFSRVQPKGGKVLFVPSAHTHFYLAENGVPVTSFFWESDLFTVPARLIVGSRFSLDDGEFEIEYTVDRIEADGVRIRYLRRKRGLSLFGGSYGSIKLKWK